MLAPHATLEHCVDASGTLLLRSPSLPETPPLATAAVRDGTGTLVRIPIGELGLDWTRAENGDGWMLRGAGPPLTMWNVVTRWGDLVLVESARAHVDERLLFATIACESGDLGWDERGDVQAPRLEPGYPRPAGDDDQGDFARDLEDWNAYLAQKTKSPRAATHARHGLLGMRLSTAMAARPELFEGVEPAHYRTVLWRPDNALAAGAGAFRAHARRGTGRSARHADVRCE